jgi:hypothetical protein
LRDVESAAVVRTCVMTGIIANALHQSPRILKIFEE